MSEATRILAAAMLLLSTAGCSFSYSVIGLSEDGPEITGSIPKKASSPLSADLNEEDWRRAKAALAVALDPQGPGTLVSWDNPDTALKGHFTPTGAPYVKNDEICRAFSAQVSGNTSASLSGHACRPSGGDWAIKDVKPAKAAAKV
ncbi:RT0821/Lpp0805 family surface protein [Microvirga antarctica]|uniref:RT0821/Lpp0805 family surface protein n=1 Tax=Microvirga antarctica TaxID=2819233 RepID=UPI001B3146C1|nr:RT0821/Lpp0805 family surface protein [Microvirga antarctica]